MKYLLDTSVYSQPLKKRPLASVIRRWKEIGDDTCCISVFCEMEVLQGLYMLGSEKLTQKFQGILKGRISVLDFSIREAQIYAELQAESKTTGRTRPVIDLCIAATAIRHRCVLATLNPKEFHDIRGLKVEDWGSQAFANSQLDL